jgi:hypothetical protein
MEQPVKWWKEYLHEHGGMEKAAKASYDLWLHKYAKPGPNSDKPKDKLEDKYLTIGKIYTFAYISQEKLDEKKQFVDHRPVIISLGMTMVGRKVFETGIDLNAIPFKLRVFILERLHKHYKSTIHTNEENINEGKQGKKALKLNYDLCKILFDQLGWEMAYMQFDRTKMTQIKPIDYSDWISLVPLYTRAMRGKQIKEIYSEYIKQMTNPKDKK